MSNTRNNLGAALEAAIAEKVKDGANREDVVSALAVSVGVSAETIEALVKGEIGCHDKQEFGPWAEVLGVSKDDLDKAHAKDIEAIKQAAAAGAGSNVVHLAAEEAERRAIAYATEVHELCMIAGRVDKASEFIAAKVPIADVRRKLAGLRADDAAESVSGAHDDAPSSDTQAIWRNAVAKTGRLKKQA